jgi:hypothetical protein
MLCALCFPITRYVTNNHACHVANLQTFTHNHKDMMCIWGSGQRCSYLYVFYDVLSTINTGQSPGRVGCWPVSRTLVTSKQRGKPYTTTDAIVKREEQAKTASSWQVQPASPLNRHGGHYEPNRRRHPPTGAPVLMPFCVSAKLQCSHIPMQMHAAAASM